MANRLAACLLSAVSAVTLVFVLAASAEPNAGASVAASGQAASPPAGGGTWQSAQIVPGLAALNSDGGASTSSISCAAPGDCTAVGYYENDSGDTQPFVASQTAGTWGDAQQVRGLATLDTGDEAELSSVSCAAAGDCTAGGELEQSSGAYQAFVVTQASGTWGKAEVLPGTRALNAGGAAIVDAVSCTDPGDCTAAGTYIDANSEHQAFVATQTAGAWASAAELPGLGALNSDGYVQLAAQSLSCAEPGDCSLGGSYNASSSTQAFLANQQSGTWQAAAEVPGTATLNTGGDAHVTSVSCPAAGDCTAVGGFYDADGYQPFAVTESGGTWGDASQLPGTAALNTGGDGAAYSVSCASAGDCAAGGYYKGSDGYQAFVAGETSSTWANATELDGIGKLNTGGDALVNSLSCPAPGDCSAVGSYETTGGGEQVFDVGEADGSWGDAQQIPGTGTLNTAADAYAQSVSCATPGSCSTGGWYEETDVGYEGFVATEIAATKTTVGLSRTSVSYGDENAERLSVTVTATGASPAGTVTLLVGTSKLCTVTLAGGTGSCTPSATRLSAGPAKITADYAGSGVFSPSASAARTLTITRAATSTSLSLSAATASYGHEQTEHLTVKVVADNAGPPAGSVTITAGRTTVCVIDLKAGQGSCSLTAKQLSPGTYHLIARYPAVRDYATSASPAKTLKVTK